MVIRWFCVVVFLFCGSACSAIYGPQTSSEDRAVAQVQERGFTQVGEYAIEGERYVRIQVLFGDKNNPCAGVLIVDMDHPKDDAGESTTIIVPDTFPKQSGRSEMYRSIPKQVRDPIISEMNDDRELDSCFGQK